MSTTASSKDRFRYFLTTLERRRDRRQRDLRSGTIAEYLSWTLRYRGLIAAVLVTSVLATILQMMEPLVSRSVIDHVLAGRPTAHTWFMLQLMCGLYVTLIATSAIVSAIRSARQTQLTATLALSLRRATLRRLLCAPFSTLSALKTGGVVGRLSSDIDTTANLLQTGVLGPAIAILRLAITLAILFGINWRLALVAVAATPAVAVGSFLFMRRARPVYKSIKIDLERLDGRTTEVFAGLRVVRSFGREHRELRHYLLGRHTALRKEMFARRRELAVNTIWSAMMALANVAILWYGGALFLSGRASLGDIFAFQWYALLLLNPVGQLVSYIPDVQRGLAAAERVFDAMSAPREDADTQARPPAPPRVLSVRFDDVGFSYTGERNAVSNFTLTITPGASVALVGRSGAGKSTVADLLARFYLPTSGRLLLNDTDVREFDLRSYRRLIAMVHQEVFLFEGTIAENIAYGMDRATADDIRFAAALARADGFIAELPLGYDTIIGERGHSLSGGQRQRLAIARALVTNPQILILDEATSNLDPYGELGVCAALSDIAAGRTVIVIAHRLSTIRTADRIVFMDAGRILECGTHEQLMRAGGPYRDFAVHQFADAGAPA